MKKLLFALLATSLLFTACKKDDNGSNPTGGGSTLAAQHYGFDGANAGAFNSTAAGIVKTSAAGITTLAISGIRNGGTESINIILYGDFSVPGTFAVGSGTGNGIVIRKDYQNVTDFSKSYSTDNDSPTMAGGGEVKITVVNGTHIEGTFYAVAHNSTGSEAYAEQGTFSGTVN